MSQPQSPIPESRRSDGRKCAAVAVIQSERRFLAIKRSATVRAPGKICFPGGGVEKGETLAEALIREMREELNINVTPGPVIWTSHSIRGFELNWMHASLNEGEFPTANPEEVESWQWMTESEMTLHPELLDSNVEFFRALQRNEFEL